MLTHGNRKMYFVSIFSLIFIFYNVKVNSMTLTGPVLTRYDPCGLGVIHFDKISDNYWQGALHFGLYKVLKSIKTEIFFAVPVTIYGPRNDTFHVYRSSNYTLFLEHPAPIPRNYIFHLQLNGDQTNIPVVSSFIMNGQMLCNDFIKDSQSVPALNVSKKYDYKKSAHVCGRRSMEHTELVSTRTEARPGDWPWHVAIVLLTNVNNIGVYNCGGTIVSWTAVLTAGHCAYKNDVLLEPEKIVVIAGTNNYRELDQVGRQQRLARKLIVHPAFRMDAATSDLAIIKVDKFQFTEYVQPICLWGPSYDKSVLFGKEAAIAGFGSIENDQQTDILRSSNTMVQNDTTCINFEPRVYTKLMNEFTFCAGFGPSFATNPRNGDSGGGLVFSSLQPDHMISWMLAGVLSKCGVGPNKTLCDPTYYVVYTHVGPHYGWISHHAGLEFKINVGI